MLTEAPLRGDVTPTYGKLVETKGWQAAAGPEGVADRSIAPDGKAGMVKYAISRFPEEEFSVAVWVSITELPERRMGQIFSAWAGGQDDPLRLTVENGKLNARIESRCGSCQTPAVSIEPGKWHHVAAVKQDCRLTLYVNGRRAGGTTLAPVMTTSVARNFALGGNPNYTAQSEYLAAKMADLRFFGRVLSAEELRAESLRQGGTGKDR